MTPAALLGAVLLAGCGSLEANSAPGSEISAPASRQAASAPARSSARPTVGAISVARTIPWGRDALIATNIQTECSIQNQLSDFIVQYGAANGLNVVQKNSVKKSTRGQSLVITIVDAVSVGNNWIGHRKSTSVRGTLYKRGRKVASFAGRRNSMGGVFAGYKGSCAVLGRTVKVLGQDIANWLAYPTDGARLGDV